MTFCLYHGLDKCLFLIGPKDVVKLVATKDRVNGLMAVGRKSFISDNHKVKNLTEPLANCESLGCSAVKMHCRDGNTKRHFVQFNRLKNVKCPNQLGIHIHISAYKQNKGYIMLTSRTYYVQQYIQLLLTWSVISCSHILLGTSQRDEGY